MNRHGTGNARTHWRDFAFGVTGRQRGSGYYGASDKSLRRQHIRWRMRERRREREREREECAFAAEAAQFASAGWWIEQVDCFA